jgi:3-(3-hydroxy-phenyl)propionate hydroxylase
VTSKDGRDILLDDAIGNWWSVLVWGNSPTDVLPAASLAQLRSLGARLACLLPDTQREWAEAHMDPDVLVLGDHTGQVKKWFDDRPTPLVFLRPDRFVAGACLIQHAPATLNAILQSMAFTPAAPTLSAYDVLEPPLRVTAGVQVDR